MGREKAEKCNKTILELMDTVIFDDEQMGLLMNEIGKNIRRERMKQNLSFNELSALTGIHPSHLYKVEHGINNVGLSTILKIAIAFDLPLNKLIPMALMHQPTNGEMFDDITRGLTPASCNYLLDMARAYVTTEKSLIANKIS
jgi:transcriptional regulator with XRE-family HTH domain